MTVPTIVGTPPYQNKSTGSLTLAGPTCQAGDLVFVLVMCINAESLLTATGANPPNIAATDSPYTQVAGSPWSDATSNKKLYLFWARATGTSIPAAQTSDPTTLVQYCLIVVRGGLASGTPYEQLTGGIDTTADTTSTIPGITTQGPDRLVIGGVTTNFDGTQVQWSAWTNANLDLAAPYGEQGDQCTNTGSGTVPGGLGAYAGGKASQGATGNTTATLANASRNVYCHFAVIPQPVPQTIQLASAIAETDALYALKVNPIRRLVKRLITELTYGAGTYGALTYGGASSDTEIDTIYPITPIIEQGNVVLVNTIIETDIVNALTINPKRRLVNSISETDIVSLFTIHKSKNLNEVTETDSIEIVSSRKTKNISSISETDSIYTLNPSKVRTFGTISETESLYTIIPQTITPPQVVELSSSIAEIDALYVLGRSKVHAFNSLTETDTIYSITARKTRTIGIVTEIESLYTFNAQKMRTLATITEIDSLYILGKAKIKANVTVVESDSIYVITAHKTRALNTIAETDSVSTITHRRSRVLGIIAETDSISTITHRKSRIFGTFTETNSIYSLKVSPFRRLVHTITETDSVWAISALGQKKINLGLITETNIVHSVKINPQHRLLNTITESETVHSISPDKHRILGTITEISSLYFITRFGVHYPSTRPGPDYLTLDPGKINELGLDENHNAILTLIARTTSPGFAVRTTSPGLTVRTTYLTFNLNHLTGVIIDENHTGYLVLSSRETSPGLNSPNKELILDG